MTNKIRKTFLTFSMSNYKCYCLIILKIKRNTDFRKQKKEQGRYSDVGFYGGIRVTVSALLGNAL